MTTRTRPPGLMRRIPAEIHTGVQAARKVGLQLPLPRRLFRMARAAGRLQSGALLTVAALRYRNATAFIDELGPLSFEDLDARSNAIANHWRRHGLGDGVGIGILCRNHRGFIDALGAATKVGGRVVLLNTDFAGPQIAEVCEREGVEVLIHDEEFEPAVGDAASGLTRLLAWTDRDSPATPSLAGIIASGDPGPPPKVRTAARVVLLTSGTTGTPKGANRGRPRSAAGGAAMMNIPFRGGETTYVAPPFFHAWGLTHALAGLGLGSTVVTRRRFDPHAMLTAIDEHACTMAVVVPVLLRRLVDAARHPEVDTSSLRIIASSGSQLEASLALDAMDQFGDILYNLYGSTEAGSVALATPSDLRAAPGCAGRPPRGVFVQLLDDRGRPVGPRDTGRIFVANGAGFGGYTGGGTKEVIRGMMSTGDVGHFDSAGRLFIDGRDDEMIVSGGENVFPREVEDLLASHPGVVEAAAVGVPDDEFGHRLRAFVVARDDVDLDAGAVQSYVRDHLARFKVPRDVVFVDELPRNPAGKVLKRLLAGRQE